MNNETAKLFLKSKPDLIKRHCGGWLAVAPSNSPLRIGVTGETEKDTILKYKLAAKKWVETLCVGEKEHIKSLAREELLTFRLSAAFNY